MSQNLDAFYYYQDKLRKLKKSYRENEKMYNRKVRLDFFFRVS